MADVVDTSLPEVNVSAPAIQQSSQSQGSGAADLYQTGPSTSNQFIRRWSLTLLGAGGQSWTISDSTASGAQSGGTAGPIKDPLRITFQTRQISTQTRGSLEVTIWNLARALHPIANLNKLYNRIVLQAGYQTGRFGKIFDGTIIDFQQGRSPNLTEVFLIIHAGDGDLPYNVATTNLSYKAGTKVTDVLSGIAKTMEDYGATVDKMIGIPITPLIRGVAHWGMSKDQFRKYGTDTYIKNNNLTVFKPGTQFQNNTWDINAKTGLVSMAASLGDRGIEFDCLLNPQLNMYDIVNLNNASINVAQGTVSDIPGQTTSFGPGVTTIGYFVDPSLDGRYLVAVVEHNGDTRGNEWYTHVRSWPVGTALTPGSDLPNYNFDATKGQQQVATETPTIPDDPTGGYYQDTGGFVI